VSYGVAKQMVLHRQVDAPASYLWLNGGEDSLEHRDSVQVLSLQIGEISDHLLLFVDKDSAGASFGHDVLDPGRIPPGRGASGEPR